LRFLHFQGATLVQPPREHVGKTLGHMLHHHNGARKIPRQLRQQILQRVGPARGNADCDHTAGRARFFVTRLFRFLKIQRRRAGSA
jgi:hypothetical protein